MSDSTVVLTAAELLQRLQAEQERVLARYRSNNGPDAWREFAAAGPDQLDQAQAVTAFGFRQIENDADRGKLELIGEAIARIGADAVQFDACQSPHCQSGGKIEHERLAILPWAKFCCVCAAVQQRR